MLDPDNQLRTTAFNNATYIITSIHNGHTCLFIIIRALSSDFLVVCHNFNLFTKIIWPLTAILHVSVFALCNRFPTFLWKIFDDSPIHFLPQRRLKTIFGYIYFYHNNNIKVLNPILTFPPKALHYLALKIRVEDSDFYNSKLKTIYFNTVDIHIIYAWLVNQNILIHLNFINVI